MINQINKFDSNEFSFTTKKVGNKKIELSTHVPFDEKQDPYLISYLDINKNEHYDLNYDVKTNSYHYDDCMKYAIANNETLTMRNDVKEIALGLLPSDFKNILLSSLNPLYSVSAINKTICFKAPTGIKQKITLNNDYLIESVIMQNENNEVSETRYSYDYVQDHFSEIESPLETYHEKIDLKNI